MEWLESWESSVDAPILDVIAHTWQISPGRVRKLFPYAFGSQAVARQTGSSVSRVPLQHQAGTC